MLGRDLGKRRECEDSIEEREEHEKKIVQEREGEVK